MLRLAYGVVATFVLLFACSSEKGAGSTPSTDGGSVSPGPEGDDAGTKPPEPSDTGPPDVPVTGTWEKVTVNPPDGEPLDPLGSIFVRSGTDVYVTEGSSNLGTGYYHYDGKRWTGIRYREYAPSLVGLLSGELLGYGSDITIKSDKGVDWELLPGPKKNGSPALVYELWGASLRDIYASTNGGNMRFDGTSWAPVPDLDVRQGAFAGTSEKDIWFASPAKPLLAHYDGKSWTNHWDKLPGDVTKYPVEGPYRMFASSPDNVWALARARMVARYDGAAWTIVPGPDDEWGCDLADGWASSKNNAWLVGNGGCVFHWDGKAWTKVPSGVSDDIYSIHGSDPEHVWIAPYSTTTVLRLVPERP